MWSWPTDWSQRWRPPVTTISDWSCWTSTSAEDGLDILPRLRAEPRLGSVPVVAFTAHDSRRREAFEKGVDGFVGRPFAQADLKSAVTSHLAS